MKNIKIFLLLVLSIILFGCDTQPLPLESIFFIPTSPMTIRKDGLEVTLQKYTKELEAVHQMSDDFYDENNGFLLIVKNVSNKPMKINPMTAGAFLETNLGKKYNSTSQVEVERNIHSSDYGYGLFEMIAANDRQSKIFPEITLQPGESKTGMIVFERIKEEISAAKVYIPMVKDGVEYVWTYNITIKKWNPATKKYDIVK